MAEKETNDNFRGEDKGGGGYSDNSDNSRGNEGRLEED